MIRSTVLASITVFALLAASASAGEAETAAFNKLAGDYDAWLLKENPVSAGFEGDLAALARLPDASLEADKRRSEELKAFKVRVDAIPAAALDKDEAFDRDYLAAALDDALALAPFDEARMPFSNDSGFYSLADYLGQATRIRTVEDAEAWLARLKALPAYYDQNIANARRGIETGWTQPKIVVERVIDVAKRQAAVRPENDPLLAPFSNLPPTLDAAAIAPIKAEAEKLIAEEMAPRRAAFVKFLEEEYLPKARPAMGIGSLPGGKDYYVAVARHHTTTTMTPDEIHELGLGEVKRIRGLMDGVMKETSFKGTFSEFLAFLRTDKQFYATSREQLLEKASEIAKRSDDKLPGLFGTLPRLTYGVRPVPADQEEGYTTGRYFPGSPDLGIAGGYMVNTSHLDQRALYELPALTLHEAVPGHHLQIALSQELKALRYFRRNGDATAFVEGWGLYAEYLGEEMGMYRTPYEKFGRLSYEMWRACRLVADTGIHWKGWDIEEARKCFTENTALSEHNIQTELERYVSWPGQALAYKIGELKLKELRARATERLGAQFDVRRFHDLVLLAGPMPLAMLEKRVDDWIADQQANRP